MHKVLDKVLLGIAALFVAAGIPVILNRMEWAWLILGLGLGGYLTYGYFWLTHRVDRTVKEHQASAVALRMPIKLDEQRITDFAFAIKAEWVRQGKEIDWVAIRKEAVRMWKEEHGIKDDLDDNKA
ncbi:MAG: hypothetical protein Q8P22_08260 [Chloroflexota bacterium]|nr:hypothetical protein [Chloroflexota bacterium]